MLSSASAEMDFNKLAGRWSNQCTQTQNNRHQGYTVETYTFIKPNGFKLKRQWFKDPDCKGKLFQTETEAGSFQIGKENTNRGFNPTGTYETQYITGKALEKGLLWVNDDYTTLRLSRGFGDQQNTMLGILQYNKR